MSSAARIYLFSLILSLPAGAVIVGPYTVDANTVHLFHMDEATGAGASANSVAGGRSLISFNGTAVPAANTTAQPTLTTLLGSAGAGGFGNAANVSAATSGLGLDGNNSGTFQPGTTSDGSGNSNGPDAVAHSTFADSSGSFTIEALIKLPALTGASREIICTDSSASNRGFQFRVNATGQLEFNFLSSNPSATAFNIPTSGTHAFVANEWFHAALSFDGASHTSTFYWTRLVASSTAANALGSSTVETTTGSVTGPLVIGNEGRNASGEGLIGYIDEVRVSRVVRTAGQFLFAPGDSDNDGLDDAWETTNFGNLLDEDGTGDPDHDGYNNEAEETAGSSPKVLVSTPLDIDGDGLADAWEVANFGNTTVQNGTGDPDGDFASNLIEFNAGTGPNNPTSWPDTDNDGMNDGWELNYFGSLAKTGAADSDNDGSTDKQEYDANSDPTNSSWSATKAQLTHRWSFNGSLTDSTGAANATLVDPDSNAGTGGTAALSATDVLLGGGARTTSSYVQLGAGLISGRKTPVTLEFWATQVAVQNWARIFDTGSGSTEYLTMSWTQGTTLASDRVEWMDTVATNSNNSVQPYTPGVKYHIVMTIEPRAGAGGTTRVTWYAAVATDSVLGSPRGTFDTSNTLLSLADSVFYLGRSQFTADNTANARYDEVRIWDGMLTSTERGNYQNFGPDTLTIVDTDNDGLLDSWEMTYFKNLGQTGSDDPDGDSYTNAVEYAAHSDPTLAASTPLDIDADGLADIWEMKYFGNLSQLPAGDPDGDGETNATEQTNGSAPNNRGSDSADIDSDSLPDAWELANFSDLSYNGGSDPDGDGFGNLQECQAGTNPMLASSRPAGTAVNLVPVDDGNSGTSDFGYSGSSAINSVSFVRSSLKTVGNQQFMTWYGRHQYDASANYNNTIWIGRRTLGTSGWDIYRHPSFTANTITDGHDVIAFGIDGEGYMHLSWGMHGDAFHYSKSLGPVTGNGSMALEPDTTMTGRENAVTYPQFMTLPDGDLLYLFREGASGSGDTYLNRYYTATHAWSNVHSSGNTQLPFIKGTGWSPDYNAYVNMPQMGLTNGNELTLTWCWRYSSGTSDTGSGAVGYQTNSNFYFARSTDAGVTWKHFDGTPFTLPISSIAESGVEATRAERILTIPENSSLINQAGMCLDRSGNPVIASWWAPQTPSANYRRQYMVVFRDDSGIWQTRPVSNRTIDPVSTRYPEADVRNMGRPIVVNDDSDRIIVAYRDNQDSNGITIVHSLPKAQDPNRVVWIQFELTTDNLGNYEPTIDNELWTRERQLHFLYQSADGQGYTSPANTASRISVLEWDAAAYFNQQPQPGVAFSADKTQITISCPSEPSWSYRLWSSTNMQDWTAVETRVGTGAPLEFVQAANLGESKRFWRIEYKEGGF
ncbi:MAG: BNR-4 repeat-containing protein [Luteolibacter sp.]